MPPTSCAVGIHLARKYGCRGVAEIADLWPESIIAYGIAGPHNPAVIALRWLEKWIYKKADAVVFTMEGGHDYIAEQGWEKEISRSKVFHINNGVDLKTFQYNRDHYQIADPDLEAPDTFKVVYTGSIRKVNNLGLLLDAAKEVTDARIQFLIWGDGDELPVLRQRVVDETITNVVFKGKVEKKYIPYITSKADVNYMHGTPSPLFRFGISPNKLFDYFAAGKPIFSDLPCKYNPVDQMDAGITVDAASPAQIAAQIKKMADMDEETCQRLCRNAEQAAQEYDFKVLTEKLMQVIKGAT